MRIISSKYSSQQRSSMGTENIFDDFQIYLLDESNYGLKEFTLNLLKGSNYYHFYSFNNTFSFECLF